jgi:hypothetical protein
MEPANERKKRTAKRHRIYTTAQNQGHAAPDSKQPII